MDQIQTGKFIAECRKAHGLTQAQLAEKLGITDRAVSKWETGRSMPDAGLMLELAALLGISVNELLTGKKLDMMEEYRTEAEENLLALKALEEEKNRALFRAESGIAVIGTAAFLLLIAAAAFLTDGVTRGGFIAAGAVLFLAALMLALRMEQTVGYYECRHCGERYVPRFPQVAFSMHWGTTRYMKCPRCGKRTWQKKVLTK